MAIVEEIKCARCDRKYSGVRSRCPYCGARRIGRGKYSEDSDNSRGKMLICILIMAVMVAAVGALLLTTPVPELGIPPGSLETEEPPPSSLPSESDNTSLPGPPVSPSPSPTPEPSPTPQPTPPLVESVTITYDGRRRDDFSARVNEDVPLGVRIEPPGVEFEGEIEWITSDQSVFDVVPTNVERTRVTVRGIGPGTATLIVRVGGAEAECIVRIKR